MAKMFILNRLSLSQILCSGTYKLNVDAFYFSNGTGALGVVIRNDQGEAIAGAGNPLNNLLDATTSEAIALRRGLQLVDDLGCVPVIVESDSLELVESLNGVIQIWSPYTSILMDCFLLAQRIGRVTIQHCQREANVVAHKIARFVFEKNNSIFWEEDPLALLFLM